MLPVLEALQRFRLKANASERVRRITATWHPTLFVECTDTGARYRLCIDGGAIAAIDRTYSEPDDAALLIRGDSGVLAAVFGGSIHPLHAYNDGELQVYGSQSDQVKLDAVSLVIWGA
jgi:hypothetical protein